MSKNGNGVLTEPVVATPLEERVRLLEERLNGRSLPYQAGPGKLLPLEQAAEYLGQATFDVGPPTDGERYRDRSTVIVCPTRGQIDTRMLDCWRTLIQCMNQRRIELNARGYEVGSAYNKFIKNVLEHAHLKTWKYVLTIEDDNLPPPDGHLRLCEILEEHPEWSAVAGLYHMKDAARLPLAYGYPEEFKRTGKIDHVPVSRDYLASRGGEPVEVLGIPMGFTLWRMDHFRKVPAPWYQTLSDKILLKTGEIIDHKSATLENSAEAKRCMTQDMMHCDVAVRHHGARFAVAPSVLVGHMDIETGMVY